jgi:hypothetical protein
MDAKLDARTFRAACLRFQGRCPYFSGRRPAEPGIVIRERQNQTELLKKA